MTRQVQPFRAAMLVLLAGVSAVGIAQAQPRRQSASPGSQPAAQPAPQPITAVNLSALRERAIGMLTDLASHQNPQVRANAVEGLEAAPGRVETVVGLAVLDDNVGVRSVGLMVAGRHEIDSALPAARLNASDPSPYVQAAALFALKRLDQNPDLSPLGRMLFEADEPSVRAHAAFILGEIGEDSALSMLRQAAARPMPRASESSLLLMRLQMAEAMVKLGDDEQVHTLHAALYPSRPEDLEAAALAAQILGEVDAQRSIPDLINLALQQDEQGNPMPAEIRLAAAHSVAKLGRRDGDFIADEYASSPNPAIRAQVASVYASTLPRDRLGILEAMLDDADPTVQVAAAAGVLRATNRLGGR